MRHRIRSSDYQLLSSFTGRLKEMTIETKRSICRTLDRDVKPAVEAVALNG